MLSLIATLVFLPPSPFMVTSPNGKVSLVVNQMIWSAKYDGQEVISGTLALADSTGSLQKSRARVSAFEPVSTLVPGVGDDLSYWLVYFHIEGDGVAGNVTFRVYDDAIVFRYQIESCGNDKAIALTDEGTTITPSGDPLSLVQYLENYKTSHEHNVARVPFSKVDEDRLLDTPLTMIGDGYALAITEASLRNYAGMSLMKEGGALRSKLSPRDDGTLVETTLPMKTPWRVVLIGDNVGDLVESNTIFALNEPAEGDWDWVKPGKITWPWWNGNLFDGVPPDPILSFETSKKYIDWCAENGIPYHSFVADETMTPWYYQT